MRSLVGNRYQFLPDQTVQNKAGLGQAANMQFIGDPNSFLLAYGHFAATHLREQPLSLSYGFNLPSSLTTFLSLALGFSPRLPVSVCGTVIESIHKTFLVSQHRILPY